MWIFKKKFRKTDSMLVVTRGRWCEWEKWTKGFRKKGSSHLATVWLWLELGNGMSRLGSPSLLFSFLDCSACNLQGCDAPREAIKHAWEQREWAWSWKTSHGRGRLTWELKGSRCFHHIRKERRKNIPEIKKVCEQRHRARQEEPPRAGLLGEWRLPPFASPERLR